MMLAEACDEINYGPLDSFSMTKEDFHGLGVADWLHDCGKVATPKYVMDKAKKLETIFDRIELVNARFEITARDIYSSNKYDENQKALSLQALESDRDFICLANTGGEFFDESKIERVYKIAKSYQVTIRGVNKT